MTDRVHADLRSKGEAYMCAGRATRWQARAEHVAPVHPVDALVRRVGALAVVISLAAAVAEVWR